MKVTVTGATGLIGTKLVAALRKRGDTVTVLSRNPDSATAKLGVEAVGWDPESGPAPEAALKGQDGIVHLAGEPVAQRWNPETKRRIERSRTVGTANLVAGVGQLAAAERPKVLVSGSAVGYYGTEAGNRQLDESAPPGNDFLAKVCVGWEQAATEAERLGLRTVRIRTGVVMDRNGGALKQMLTPFKLGIGGPVAGGHHYMPWVHLDDVVGIIATALSEKEWSGAFNATAPQPVTNRVFSKALGRTLHRPAVLPVPAFGLKALYGEMAEIITTGQNAVPDHALKCGYSFQHPQLDEALATALKG